MENDIYKIKKYFAMTIDPLHIGTGGYRLGRVDLSIVRDPVTNIPKIPATSIIGPARSYTAMKTKKYPNCAGKGGEKGESHCGENKPACPVCISYGFSKKNFSFQGLAQFFDARILCFPVYTMIGPVWLTSSLICESLNIPNKNFKVDNDKYYPLGNIENDILNFGWLMLKRDKTKNKIANINYSYIPESIKENLILVSDNIFSKIINSNLEVRTSVSIDILTGTAEEGALFTYEAIPRSTILIFDVVYNNPQNFKINGQKIYKDNGQQEADIEWVKQNVEVGLKLFEFLGIGGMNSKGMGRIKILNFKEEND
ncbi:MAG: type III-B CRISPR module RAMP protein Cmr4 [Promethearchaeia archaeon]